MDKILKNTYDAKHLSTSEKIVKNPSDIKHLKNCLSFKKFKGNSAKRCRKKSAFRITILKDILIKESKKLKNEQRVTKKRQGRL